MLLDLSAHPIIGHRGASGLAPENTLASFALAAELGAEAFELDVRLTADGVPVVLHDPTLDRTTDGTGPLSGRTAAALDGIDAGARFTPDNGATWPFRGRGVGIPTLRAVLEAHPAMPMLIELKESAAAGPVRRLLLEVGAEGRTVVASFLPDSITAFQTAPFRAGASRREILLLTLRSWIGGPPPADIALYAVPARYKGVLPVPTSRFVRAAARAGAPVHVWTVDDPAEAHRLWDLGCAGMITNQPGRLREARDARFGLKR